MLVTFPAEGKTGSRNALKKDAHVMNFIKKINL
jgi:hypothetical protein